MSKPLKGTRLPEDWQPGQLELDYINKRRPRLSQQQRADLIDDFVDYWTSLPGTKALKLNWTRTFYTHVRSWKPWMDEPKPQRLTTYPYNRPAATDPYSDDVAL